MINKLCTTVDKLGARLTLRLRHAHVIHMLDTRGTLTARALQGLTARPKGAARWVAVVIGISLSIATPLEVYASNPSNKELRKLANYQLTDKQYNCHNKIIYKESRWISNAVGNLSGTKQVHGYYQMKTTAAKDAHYYKQFYLYWYYVTHRYGVTKYDEPDYCNALKHLMTKGWQ